VRHPRTSRRAGSVYALSKYDRTHELLVGGAYGIPAVALRFFNAYGPRQALSIPIPGSWRFLAGPAAQRPAPLIFEDGRQKRDSVHVRDIARACGSL